MSRDVLLGKAVPLSLLLISAIRPADAARSNYTSKRILVIS